jgi:hypothetical protein
MSAILPLALGVSAARPTVDAENPWPGLESFREQDQPFFRGRDPEADELVRRVRREGVSVVLFGQSGLGKSSLLQAGLFPRLREQLFLPVLVRLAYDAGAPPPREQVLGAIASQAAASEVEAPPADPAETLWEYFHRTRNEFWTFDNRPALPLLVFDQFEEAFTLGRRTREGEQRTAAFLEELGDLIEGRPSRELRARLDRDADAVAAFSFSRQPCKVVLVVREDFLAELETLTASVRSLAVNRMRLEPLRGTAALLVTAAGGPVLVPPPDHSGEPGVGERIVRLVAGEPAAPLENLVVDPALLSLFCRELNQRRKELRQDSITADLVEGSSERILEDFYERSIGDLDPAVRLLVEERLLTVDDRRDSMALENAVRLPGVTEEAVSTLVERRLIRREERDRRSRIELTHDVLTKVVAKSRDRRKAQEKAAETAAAERAAAEAAAARAQAEADRLKAEAETRAKEEQKRTEQLRREAELQRREALAARRASRIARTSAAVCLLLAVLAVAFAFDAGRERKEARAAEARAESALRRAVDAESSAVRNRNSLKATNQQLETRNQQLRDTTAAMRAAQKQAQLESSRANRSIAVAQQTIDGVLHTLESDRIQEVWGFQSVEQELLDRLLQLQSDLGGERRRSAAVQSTLLMRRANLANNRGNIEEALELYEQAYRAIISVALRPNATQEQRTLALRAAYRYYNALGDLSRSEAQERILTESEPVLRTAIAEGNLTEQGRGWAAHWLNNKRQFFDSHNDHDQALRVSDEAMAIVRMAGQDSASVEARVNYALVLTNRAYTLRSLHRDEQARQVDQQACGIYDDLYAKVPTHRNVLRLRIYCFFDRASARYDRRDREGALAAIREAITLATPAARVNGDDATFQAALATAYYRTGEVEHRLDNAPATAMASYRQSMRIWGELYRGNNIQVGEFDNLESTFDAYTMAMDALEQQDSTLKAPHAEAILTTFNSFKSCGERLGGMSSCGRVVMAAARAAADRLFAMNRGTEVIEPLRVAERLSRQLETVPWNQSLSDTYGTSCAFRRDVGRALVLANRQREAVEPLRQAIEQCGVFMRRYDYDIYIRSAVLGAHLWLSRAERATNQAPAARRTLAACYSLYGANCYDEYAEMLERGIGGPVDMATARQVRAQRAYTNMKRFTIPVHAPGSEVTFPFYVYIFERPPNFPYQGIDDQIRWLQVNRGLEVPPDVGPRFRRLEARAREKHMSFPDLAVRELGVVKADTARRPKL